MAGHLHENSTEYIRKTAKNCTESDLYLVKHIMPRRVHGIPVQKMVFGTWSRHCISGTNIWATFYTGQFFYDDDLVDESRFIQQAETYGFDKDAYLAAFRQIPVYNRKNRKAFDALFGQIHLLRIKRQLCKYKAGNGNS